MFGKPFIIGSYSLQLLVVFFKAQLLRVNVMGLPRAFLTICLQQSEKSSGKAASTMNLRTVPRKTPKDPERKTSMTTVPNGQ